MKKLLIGLLFALVLLPAVAHAANCSPFTYTLTNGTTADASQVMSNFNNLLNCSNNNLAGLAQPNAFTQTQTYGALNAYSSAAATVRGSLYQTSGSTRWELYTNGTSESGGNAGSNFALDRFDDTGNLIDEPFEVARSSGLVILQDGLSVTGSVTLTTALPIAQGGTGATSASAARTALGVPTGTSGANLPFLNGTNTWSGAQSHNAGTLVVNGATSGSLTINCAATCGARTLTFPAGTTDFSATGGASQVVKQTSAGGALTVGQLAAADISGLGTAATVNTGTSGATIPILNASNTYGATSGTTAFAGRNEFTGNTGTTISSCGTSPGGTTYDNKGAVSIGGGVVTACTVTFHTAFASAPVCVVSMYSGAPSSIEVSVQALSTTAFTVGFNANAAASNFTYICL